MKQFKTVENIICLTDQHLPVGATDAEVADLLMELIKKAQRAELLGIAVAYVEGNNKVSVRIASGAADAAMLVGAVGALDYEINKRWNEQND